MQKFVFFICIIAFYCINNIGNTIEEKEKKLSSAFRLEIGYNYASVKNKNFSRNENKQSSYQEDGLDEYHKSQNLHSPKILLGIDTFLYIDETIDLVNSLELTFQYNLNKYNNLHTYVYYNIDNKQTLVQKTYYEYNEVFLTNYKLGGRLKIDKNIALIFYGIIGLDIAIFDNKFTLDKFPEWDFGFDAGCGIDLIIKERFSIRLEYRYSNIYFNSFYTRFKVNTVSVGFGYLFKIS